MEPNFTPNNNQNSVVIPIAIVAGFGLIALAIYFSGLGGTRVATAPTAAPQPATAPQATGQIRPVDETDFIKGNPNAPILIVEYSDYECVFCKQFHETMHRIMSEYGINGNVAWVYRQFPITQLHPNSERISETALCVGEVGGNEAFWKFTDNLFFGREAGERIDVAQLPVYAEVAGVPRAELLSCLDSGRQRTVLEASIADGIQAGVQGTPQSFIIVGNQMEAINGAQPYAVMKGIIDSLLAQLAGGAATPPPAPASPQ